MGLRRNNALGEEEFVPQQTEAVRAANFEKVRKGRMRMGE